MTRLFFCLVFCIISNCYANQTDFDQEIKRRFVVESEPACKRIKAVEPRRPNTPFFSMRYYLSLDGEGNCQILDVWIQRLTNFPNDNRREVNSVIYRFNGRAWLQEYGLDDKPLLRIKDQKTGIVYYFTELNEDLFYRKAIVYFSGAWEGKGGVKINSGLQPLDLCQNIPVFECRFIDAALERIIQLELRK